MSLVCSCSGNKTIKEPVAPVTAVSRPDFKQGLSATLGPSWTSGNKIETLNNGNEIFPAMLTAIRGAKKTINFETFVYWKGDTPKAVSDALCERARAGVKVNVIIDGNGGGKSKVYHKPMRDAGVNLVVYHPVGPFTTHRYNYRTHRKVLVVDGKIGFIGGVGIADEWNGDVRNEKEWRDTHYRVEGPVVSQLQGIFANNWMESRHEALQGPDYYPPLPPKGSVAASTFLSDPEEARCNIEIMYHLAVASAQKTLYISTPYFVPDKVLVQALADAAKRGVQVIILVPGENIDKKSVRRASKRKWPELLAAGVRIFEFEPSFTHTKLIIVDGELVSVGSGNFDPRSLRINDEANMNVLDRGFASIQTKLFFEDLKKSKEVEGSGGAELQDTVNVPVGVAEKPVESQL